MEHAEHTHSDKDPELFSAPAAGRLLSRKISTYTQSYLLHALLLLLSPAQQHQQLLATIPLVSLVPPCFSQVLGCKHPRQLLQEAAPLLPGRSPLAMQLPGAHSHRQNLLPAAAAVAAAAAGAGAGAVAWVQAEVIGAMLAVVARGSEQLWYHSADPGWHSNLWHSNLYR
jgi:hypothetical protein